MLNGFGDNTKLNNYHGNVLCKGCTKEPVKFDIIVGQYFLKRRGNVPRKLVMVKVSLSDSFIFFQPRDRNSSVGEALIDGRVGSGGARPIIRVFE